MQGEQREPAVSEIRERFAELRHNLDELERAGAPEGLVASFRTLLSESDALCALHTQARQEGLAGIERRWASLLNEQKETRETLRRERHFVERLVDTVQAIVLVIDTAGRITFFNPYMEEVSGYSLDEVRGEDWFIRFIPQREHQRLRELFERAVGDMEVRGNVNAIVTKAGVEREIEWYAKTLKDAHGHVLGLVSVGHDITERKRLESSYRQAQKMEAIGTLTSGIAHDYNNLLMGVLGCLDVALQKPSIELARPYLEGARDATRRGGALTRQLLTFSQRRETEPSEVDVNQVVQEADRMMRSLVGEAIDLRIALGQRGWMTRADPGQLEQVIMNLVVNARDAMPDGGVLTVETSEAALAVSEGTATGVLKEGDYVTVSVHDTGVGMSDETRERIFEPFFSTKGVGKGTGLGLSTVYGIVTGCGGHIQVTSRLGVGTEFKIFLPRVASTSETLRPPPVEEESRLGSEVVLIVEDEPLVRLAVRGYLEPSGYRILEACDATEASLVFQRSQRPIDLLIADAMLPGGSGRQVAEELQAWSPHLPVIFMSAHPAETLYESGRVPRGATTLEKPFTESELIRLVRSVLGEGRKPSSSDLTDSNTNGADAGVRAGSPGGERLGDSASKKSAARHQGTLLLVEDSQAARRASAELLTDCGYNVLEASTAREALDLFHAAGGEVDAVLTDIGLPERGVDALVSGVRLVRPNVPIVLVSGYSEHEPEVRSLLQSDNTVHVQKPIDIGALERRVRALLDQAASP